MKFFWTLLFMIAILFPTSCGRRDKGVLNEKTMENVLYDYHLSQALAAQSSDSAAYKQWFYADLVFKKYGITEADFNSSLHWYMCHAKSLQKIYAKVGTRLSSISANSNGVLTMSGINSSDSTDIWRNVPSVILNSASYNNHYSFTISADSSFHVGDSFQWLFNTTFIYSQGARQAMAVLSITYQNDSVESRYVPIYSGGNQMVEIIGSQNGKVKYLSGLVYQLGGWNAIPKLLVVSDFILLKIRKVEEINKVDIGQTKQKEVLPANTDSANGVADVSGFSHPSPASDSAHDKKRLHFKEVNNDPSNNIKHKEHFYKGKLIRE